MKNIILKNGMLSGIIVSGFMVYGTYRCYQNPKGFEPSYVLGFIGMFISFVFIYWGIKQYRDNQNNGLISFGKAFEIGTLIALIASLIYVGVWLIEYYLFIPDFMEKYANYELSHAEPENLAAKTAEMNNYKELYKNPALVILMTLMEIFPLGIMAGLISALLLKRSDKKN